MIKKNDEHTYCYITTCSDLVLELTLSFLSSCLSTYMQKHFKTKLQQNDIKIYKFSTFIVQMMKTHGSSMEPRDNQMYTR